MNVEKEKKVLHECVLFDLFRSCQEPKPLAHVKIGKPVLWVRLRGMTNLSSGLSVDDGDVCKYVHTIDQCVQKLVPSASFYWML